MPASASDCPSRPRVYRPRHLRSTPLYQIVSDHGKRLQTVWDDRFGLVPGYVKAREVSSIAGFIARIDRRTPYSLLAFHPAFAMTDLPYTSRAEAEAAVGAAKDAGLKRITMGNVHILQG